MASSDAPPYVVYLDNAGHFKAVVNTQTGQPVDLPLARVSVGPDARSSADSVDSHSHWYAYSDAGYGLSNEAAGSRPLMSEASMFHNYQLGPASATPLGSVFADCLFDHTVLSNKEQKANSMDVEGIDGEDGADADDYDDESDAEEEASMNETYENTVAMRESEMSAGRGGRSGGGGGGGRSGGGGGGGRSFNFKAPSRPITNPLVRSQPTLRRYTNVNPSLGLSRPPLGKAPRVLTPPNYARRWMATPRGYNENIWRSRYRTFVPFLPLVYASLPIPWSFWYPSSRYVYINRRYRESYGLPLLFKIQQGASLEWIESMLQRLRIVYTDLRSKGYEIVPRFYNKGDGRFVWVMTNQHPTGIDRAIVDGSEVYGSPGL